MPLTNKDQEDQVEQQQTQLNTHFKCVSQLQ